MRSRGQFGRHTGQVPACSCSQCQKHRASQRKRQGDPMENAGRVQHGAKEKGWQDGGTDHCADGLMFGHLRPIEAADREEREAYGKPLQAGYRYILGPTPKLAAGDINGAKQFLTKIELALERGPWTRNEWKRLHLMRDKWRRRAAGKDGRFAEVGNMTGGLDKATAGAVKDRNVVQGILEAIRGSKLK